MATIFDILNVNPAESVAPVQPGLLGAAQTLGQTAGRGAAQAVGRDTRSQSQKVSSAARGVNPNDPASLLQMAERLDQVGETTRAAAVRQMAQQLQQEMAQQLQQETQLSGRDRFVTAGANVFDMQTGTWRTPPSESDAQDLSGRMTQNQIAGLYDKYTPESIAEFVQDPTKPLVPLGEPDPEEELTPEQRRANTIASLQKTDEALQNLSLAEDIDVWNFGYDLAKFMPMSNSKALAGYVSSLQAELAFGRLQEMREASKTGGALGQVSEKELDLLKNSLVALDPASPVFAEQLSRVRQHYNDFKNALLGLDPTGEQYMRDPESGHLIYYNAATDEFIDLDALSSAREGR